MDLAISLLLAVCVANVLFGLFVLLRDPRSAVMRSFFGISIFISLWAISNYLTENAHSLHINSIFNRFAYFFGFMAILFTAIFSSAFSHRPIRTKRGKIIAATTVGAIGILSLTPYIAGTVDKEGDKLVFSLGSLMGLYVIVALAFIGITARNFYSVMRSGNPLMRVQAKIISASLIVSMVIGVGANVVIPMFTSDFSTAKFGPGILSLFLIGTTSYAIVRHKLFDIRLFVARSLAYILSISILVAGFALSTSLILEGIVHAEQGSGLALVINMIEFIIAVSLYPFVKRYFDRFTNRLFYQDAYDTQSFLDQLNKTVIGNIELGILLRHSAQVIENNLKCEYVLFSVFEGSKPGTRYVSGTKKAGSIQGMDKLKDAAAPLSKIIDTDTVEENYPDLYTLLVKNDISVLSKLVSSLDATTDPTAFMLLGPKKSGNRYSQQDLRIIEIISDELVVAIQNALRFEEIQNFNITLQEKVDEATRKLRKTNEKLKEMDETKDDFISMASHQLRTPLTSVKGYLSMVLEGDAGKVTAMQEKMLQQAFVSSQRMTYLISDLLNVSRLKTGKFVIERTPTNLVAMVQQEIAQLTEAAKGRNLTLLFDPPKEFPNLMLDETKTRQLIMNFVDNAIYYTPPGGIIEIKVADKPESVELTVVDNGLGVPRRDQPHLFTKFYRANNARKARPDGTGLGLFMAKKVVIAQGGAIIFRSQEGKGSTFGFTFPKTKELTAVH